MLFFMLLLLILLNVLAWLQHTKNAWADTGGLDQLHQVSVTSGTGHPWHKARDNRNSAKPQWKVGLKVK